MQFCNIDGIPNQIQSGKLTKDEGAKLIESIVRTNPASFGIVHLNEQITTLLLLNFASNCKNIVNIYNPAGGTLLVQLMNYIHYLVRVHKHLWLKAQYAHASSDEEEDPPRMHGVRRIVHGISCRRRRTYLHHRGKQVAMLSLV